MHQKKVVIIHTSFVSVEDLKALFAEIVPEATVFNIVDDSLLPEVLGNGGVTEGVKNRIIDYAEQAESIGADLVFNQCSSVGEAADIAKQKIGVPLLKIDEAMAEEAVRLGVKIGVVATLETTLGPTVRLVEAKAAEMGKPIEITRQLCEGAFDCLISGNREKHNAMVLQAIHDLSDKVDVIVLAQGSMVALLPYLKEVRVPVLTSPRLGVQRAKEFLRQKLITEAKK